MAFQSMPKMSLVAQYDDLCRYTKILTAGPEEEFKIFVRNQLNCLQKRKETGVSIKKYQDRISSLEAERKRFETQIKHLRDLCETEVVKRKKVETEKDSVKKQIDLIKEVLLADGAVNNETKVKLAFLNSTSKPNSPPRLKTIQESFLNLSDITDDLDNTKQSSRRRSHRSKGKRSSSENRVSPKKKKVDTEDESDDNFEMRTPYKAPDLHSSSEPTNYSPEIHVNIHQQHKSDSHQAKFNTYDLRRYNTGGLSMGTPNGQYSTDRKLNRGHSFVQKYAIRFEKCNPCGKGVRFGNQVLKCQDCRVICHPECKDMCTGPCIPTSNTPTKATPGARLGNFLPPGQKAQTNSMGRTTGSSKYNKRGKMQFNSPHIK